MLVGNALRELGAFLDECDQRGSVTSVGLPERIEPGETETIASEIQLTLTTRSKGGGAGAMTLCAPDVDADGTLRLSFESVEAIVPVADYDVDVEPVDVRVEDTDTFTVTLFASVSAGDDPTADDEERIQESQIADESRPPAPNGRSSDEMSAEEESAEEESVDRESSEVECATRDEDTGPTASRNRDVPPFRDRDLLEDVYESCDTFAEMTDALGMDVTAETVRRYMIDHGIHQPNSYNTSDEEGLTEADSQTPVVLADGIGLPDGITVDTLVDAVEQSNTIYEFKQGVGLDRRTAHELLKKLNLLDLVVGRLSTQAEREVDRTHVIERLREVSAAQ